LRPGGRPARLEAWTEYYTGTSNQKFAVCFGNGLFVAVGDNLDSGPIITSPDGINWTPRARVIDQFLYGVAYGNGQLVAVGNAGTILTSANGTNWTTRAPLPADSLFAVAYGNGRFVATGYGYDINVKDYIGMIFTSPDGVSWTPRISNTRNTLYGISYGNGQFVIGGDYGTILQSEQTLPRMTAIHPLPDGAAQVLVTGLPEQNCPIQASTNLSDWVALTNVVLTNGVGQFSDPSAPNFNQRFYRTALP
jgi:hypothetical protein